MPENIQTILQQVKKDKWREKLKEIKSGLDAYEKWRSGQSSSTFDKIIEKHLNPILPQYWEVFHTHNIYRRKTESLPCRENDFNYLPCYDVGIFLVGFRSLPIVLSLAEIQPREQIYFLYSTDTKDMLDEIGNRIRAMLCDSNPGLVELVEDTVLCNMDNAALAIDNPSDPVTTFKRIKEVVDNVGNKSIALDLTGGKKTMIGGGFTAGSLLGFADSIRPAACDMFYIDSLEYNVNLAGPVPGTEFLSLLENPYDVYNVQTVQSAKELFRQHNYEAAVNLWGDVEKKLQSHATRYGLKAEMAETINHCRMANCYKLWDAFYYRQAKGIKDRHNDWGYKEKHVRDSIDVLDILDQVGTRETLFYKEARIIHYAVDRYQNAIRRRESGKLDDAIVRFTQVVEMLCIYKIHQIARDESLLNAQGNSVNNPPSKWDITPLILFLFGQIKLYNGQQNRQYRISDCNQLLNITDYGYNDVSDITNLIETRNEFVHFTDRGRQTQTEENAKNLKKLAQKFLKNFSCSYCCNNSLSFKDLLKLHRFRR